jgi:hypothetical protein
MVHCLGFRVYYLGPSSSSDRSGSWPKQPHSSNTAAPFIYHALTGIQAAGAGAALLDEEVANLGEDSAELVPGCAVDTVASAAGEGGLQRYAAAATVEGSANSPEIQDPQAGEALHSLGKLTQAGVLLPQVVAPGEQVSRGKGFLWWVEAGV